MRNPCEVTQGDPAFLRESKHSQEAGLKGKVVW